MNALDTVGDEELLEELDKRFDHMAFVGLKDLQINGSMRQLRPYVRGNPALLHTQVSVLQQHLLTLVILGQSQ